MKPVIYFLFLILVTLRIHAQLSDIKPVHLRAYSFSQIMGMKDSSILLMTSKVGDINYTNQFYTFDRSLNLKEEGTRFKSKHSCLDKWTFFLDNKIYMGSLFETELKNYHNFFFEDTISLNGIAKETSLDVFKIDSRKDGKLHSQLATFDCIKGTHESKVLLTYNNDYTENYPEGFIYRIMESDGKISEHDSLSLPYNDRISNIHRIVYDDVESVFYILSEVYKFSGKNNDLRTTDHFCIFKFNLQSRQLLESKPFLIPDSSRYQMELSENSIYLLTLQRHRFISESDSICLFRFGKQNADLQSLHVNYFNREVVDSVNKDRAQSFRSFVPVDLKIINDTSIISVYESQFTSKEWSQNSAAAAVVGSFIGLASAAFFGYGFFFVPTGEIPTEFSGDMLLVNFDSSGTSKTLMVERTPIARNNSHAACATVYSKNNFHILTNDWALNKRERYVRVVYDISYNVRSKSISVDRDLFNSKKIFNVDPNSAFKRDSSFYFIGNGYFEMSVRGENSESELEESYCIFQYTPE